MHGRIRRKVRGTTERPRLAVYRSLNHIYAQLIDDEKAQTIAATTAATYLVIESSPTWDRFVSTGLPTLGGRSSVAWRVR